MRKSFAGTSGILPAVGPIDLDVGEGEFICLIGPSGCGKTQGPATHDGVEILEMAQSVTDH